MLRIPLEGCKHSYLYKIFSRNLRLGVFNAQSKGFIGIRTKFGYRYLFTEYHYDFGAPFGTVNPKKELEECPYYPYEEIENQPNIELFKWLEQKEKEYLEDEN